MKRLKELTKGVFAWSTGQTGTRDLPVFLAECAYHQPKTARRTEFMLRNIGRPVDNRQKFTSQLLRAYGQYKQACKAH